MALFLNSLALIYIFWKVCSHLRPGLKLCVPVLIDYLIQKQNSKIILNTEILSLISILFFFRLSIILVFYMIKCFHKLILSLCNNAYIFASNLSPIIILRILNLNQLLIHSMKAQLTQWEYVDYLNKYKFAYWILFYYSWI